MKTTSKAVNRPNSTILKSVTKPGRYAGGEYGQIIKDKTRVKARFAFCFPDTYEIGMSNLGVRLLYGALNQHPDIWCERVYDPWVDMQEQMKLHDLPLVALESGDPLDAFDFVAFTLQYEMSYTNVLNMLDLAGIPLRTRDRAEDDPLIIGGGPCAFNPEPVADFFDLFNIGEGENMLPAIVELYIRMKDAGTYTRAGFLHEAARTIPGVYVPSLYEVSYNADGTVQAYTPVYDDIPKKVTKQIIRGQGLFPGPRGDAVHRNGARPHYAGGLPRLYQRLPLLSGGHDLPPRARKNARRAQRTGEMSV